MGVCLPTASHTESACDKQLAMDKLSKMLKEQHSVVIPMLNFSSDQLLQLSLVLPASSEFCANSMKQTAKLETLTASPHCATTDMHHTGTAEPEPMLKTAQEL